jgi:hypothetical protein
MSTQFSVDAGLVLAARIFTLLIFTRALLAKARHPQEFIGVVAGYRLLPEPLLGAAAWMVLGLEGVVVLGFLTGCGLARTACLAAVLLCLFALAMAINVGRGRTEIDCGCFRDALRQRISNVSVLRNLLLAALASLPALAAPTNLAAVQLVNGLCGGITLFLVFMFGEQMAAVRRQGALLRNRWS